MTTPRRTELVAALRQRLLRALQAGALTPGDRLPGTREVGQEFDVDPRVVAAAYRELAAEGLVELRARAGAYLHRGLPAPRPRARPSTGWLAEVFAAGVARGVAAPELSTLLRRALGRDPVTVAVIASTVDQAVGICRELERHLGLAPSAVLAEQLPHAAPSTPPAEYRAAMPRAVHRARLLVTTEAHAKRVAEVAARLEKPSVAVTVRSELYESEWALLRAVSAYVLVADPRFAAQVEAYLRKTGADAKVRVYVVGRDAVSALPPEAPVYVTQAARDRLGPLRLPAGALAPARVLSEACVAAVLQQVLELVRADAAGRAGPPARRAAAQSGLPS
jgi:DNA-binding transcriptional regulator YhcF (GntR family)